MKKFEKHTLIKFTLIYFISTAVFVLLLGFLYFKEQTNLIIQQNTIKMHQYLVKLKQSGLQYKQKHYSFTLTQTKAKYNLATKHGNYYEKAFPTKMGRFSIVVRVDAQIIDEELHRLKHFVISIQFALLVIFLLLGYLLAKLSLKPINDTVSHLDRFIKDLIHDLNTPISSILLNIKVLKNKTDDEKLLKPINRIESSANSITALYDNLEIIIDKSLKKETIDIYKILEEKKENCKLKFPNISWDIKTNNIKVFTNKKSIIRILDNILANSCKYAQDTNPKITIDFKNNTLFISDNGKGIKTPKKVFERSYSEDEKGHGIGMHIVQRLCSELDIKITIDSKKDKGTTVKLSF